jgi:dCTP deaminase
MSTLCDSQLIELCKAGMVSPFDKALVNPASIDLRVGVFYCLPRLAPLTPTCKPWSDPIPLGDGYELHQGCTILLDTLEYVRIPVRCMAEMWLKSSAGRNGIDTYKAGYVDPGFHGTLTFRITNQIARPFLVKPGMRLVQMVVREMSKVPDKPYTVTGRYNGQVGPTEAR